MATEVYLHVGLPKTGTTYLQSVLWGSRDTLAADGWLLPGSGHREHLWAALDLQEHPHLARRHADAPGTLRRLVEQVRRHDGPALLTHEFLCAAGRDQARGLIESLAPARVHVVVTARDTLGMLTAGWVEYVKNGGTLGLDQMSGDALGGQTEFGWRTWDLAGVLRRWGRDLPPEQVHVIPMPGRAEPPDRHWRNFAAVLGLDPTRYDLPAAAANTALGATQIELLRRVNPHLGDFHRAVDRGTWIRGFLAEAKLAATPGERVAADADQVAECRERAERSVRMIQRLGLHVQGDVERLRVPAEPPTTRRPADITDAELLEAASTLIADMLGDVRRLSGGKPSPTDETRE